MLWGWAAAWALSGGKRTIWLRVRVVLLAGAAAAVLCLPGLPVALRQIPGYRNTNLVVPTAGSYLADLARVYSLGEFFGGASARPWQAGLAALLAGGVLLSVYAFIRKTRSGDRGMGGYAGSRPRVSASPPRSAFGPVGLVLLWAVLPLLLYYAAIADRGTFATRYISVALPAWLLLAALALQGYARVLPPPRGDALGAAAAVVLLVIFIPGLRTDLFDQAHFRDDTQGVIKWLREHTDPARDIILVDQRYPFGFYYERWNNLHGGTPPETPADETPAQYLFVDFNTLADRLTQLGAGRSHIYTIRWWESDTDPRGGVPFLLDKFGVRLGKEDFRGYTVTGYEVAPDTQFELTDGLHAPRADFGSPSALVRLEGVDFGGGGPDRTSTLEETRAPTASADGTVWAVAGWSQLAGGPSGGGPGSRGLKATLLLEDEDGVIVARDDRALLNDRHVALNEWNEGDRPLTVFELHPSPATPPGRYTLKLSVYDPETLKPLAVAVDAPGGAAGGLVVLGQVDLTRAAAAADPAGLPLDMTSQARWAGVTLLGRGALAAEVSPGGTLPVDLFWRAEADSPGPVQFRLALVPVEGTGAPATTGEPVAAILPTGGRYPSMEWHTGEVVRQRGVLSLPPTLPPGGYRLVVAPVEGDASRPGPGEVELGRVQVAGRADNFEPPAALARPSGAAFGPEEASFAALLGSDEPAAAGGSIALALFWQAREAAPIPYAVSVQALDAHGVLIGQRDQQPGGGEFPTNGWIAGEVLADRYELVLPPGAYRLIVKMYDPATGQVVPVTLPGPTAAQEFAPLGEVVVP